MNTVFVETSVVSCTLPKKLVTLIDKNVRKHVNSRATWIRDAIFEKAKREGLIGLERDANREVYSLDIAEVTG